MSFFSHNIFNILKFMVLLEFLNKHCYNNSLFFEMISLEIKSIVKNINKELSMYINIPLNPFIISIVAIMTATTEKISIK